MKNPNAVALGKMKRGVKEKRSLKKKRIVCATLELARLKRWPKKK